MSNSRENYQLFVNNKWTPIYFDAKHKQLSTHQLIKINDTDKIKLIVGDKKKNIRLYEQ